MDILFIIISSVVLVFIGWLYFRSIRVIKLNKKLGKNSSDLKYYRLIFFVINFFIIIFVIFGSIFLLYTKLLNEFSWIT